ncbi:MAG: VWA domain-containing protein [Rhodobacteraceae bacterium]|nr:VWA domain-containing protein [Paracoccaceae bacterium]
MAVDPKGLSGIAMIARAGPVRERWITLLDQVDLPRVALHPNMSDDALYGGLDLSGLGGATALTRHQGVLERAGCHVLTGAERCAPELAARLALALDDGAPDCLVALIEAAEPEDGLPRALADRLAFSMSLEGVPMAVADLPAFSDLQAARARLEDIALTDAVAPLVSLAQQLGVRGLRAPLMACRAARAHAALTGRLEIAQEDLELAAALVLAPRATQLPQSDEAPPPPPPEEEDRSDPSSSDPTQMEIPQELLIAAVQAVLPDGVLPSALSGGGQGAGGAGAKRKGNRRGRPLPARPGRPDGANRLDIGATLRAAAPWQRLRARAPGTPRLTLRPQDLRIKRYESRSDRLLIFAVDASGSQALTRLGEVKGAVELLLARAYASRDHAALVAFRAEGAEVLLPPTRALVQAKKQLAGLPGGGGTPLAAGLQASGLLGLGARRQGLSPLILLLTDGKANVPLTPGGGRAQARQDAEQMAGWLRGIGVDSVVLDTGVRPQPALHQLAAHMGARHLALPRAGAEVISRTVEQVTAG